MASTYEIPANVYRWKLRAAAGGILSSDWSLLGIAIPSCKREHLQSRLLEAIQAELPIAISDYVDAQFEISTGHLAPPVIQLMSSLLQTRILRTPDPTEFIESYVPEYLHPLGEFGLPAPMLFEDSITGNARWRRGATH